MLKKSKKLLSMIITATVAATMLIGCGGAKESNGAGAKTADGKRNYVDVLWTTSGNCCL